MGWGGLCRKRIGGGKAIESKPDSPGWPRTPIHEGIAVVGNGACGGRVKRDECSRKHRIEINPGVVGTKNWAQHGHERRRWFG